LQKAGTACSPDQRPECAGLDLAGIGVDHGCQGPASDPSAGSHEGGCIRSATDGEEGIVPGATKDRRDAVEQTVAAQHCPEQIDKTDVSRSRRDVSSDHQ
jgi:hypothetical protein